jgi:hypothetical protein
MRRRCDRRRLANDNRSAVYMLRLEWNSLRAGDRVLVHDADDPQLRLVAGVVSAVLQTSGANEVSIRVTTPVGVRVVKPQRLSVHPDPVGFDGQCWRCAGPQSASQASTAPRRKHA